ncbi:MAG TPA: ferrous iron transport protein A [Clostridiales bacterium]|jgi:Fe2+ transport system protein FeoA|nr:ferrous iron transport protein A [Clostridiales bacterium]
MPTYTLDTLCQGEAGTVSALMASGAERRRLMDIGLTPGTTVKSLFRSCSGDPTAYLIQGAVIALRREDAHTVLVRTTI